MTNQVKLSNAFNTALGTIPAVISILFAYVWPDIAIYAGAVTGIAYTTLLYIKREEWIPNFILYATTLILLALTVIEIIKPLQLSAALPIVLEILILIPLLIIYFNGNCLMCYLQKREKTLAKQGLQSAMVSIRILLLFALIHLLFLVVGFTVTRSANNPFMWFLLTVAPLLVFLSSMAFNHAGIRFFNKTMSQTRYIPVVNGKGSIMGKVVENDLPAAKNSVKIPVVRIAIESHGMLFLCDNSPSNILGSGKLDTPLETVVYYKETLEDAVQRLLILTFPTARRLKPRFSIKYQFKDETADRLVYLFILNVKDDIILCDSRFENGKLWTFKQIGQNINKGIYSHCFEQEYEHVEAVIGTIKRYRES